MIFLYSEAEEKCIEGKGVHDGKISIDSTFLLCEGQDFCTSPEI